MIFLFKETSMVKTAATEKQTDLLTMADLAARFSLPESTARYYCRRFNAFLPQEGQGRRRYKPEAVEVLAAVKEAMGRTKHARSVEMELSLQFASRAEKGEGDSSGALVPLLHDSGPGPALREFSLGFLQAVAAQTRALERIADVLSLAVQPGAVQTAGAQEGEAARQVVPEGAAASSLNSEIESLRKDIKTLRGLMSSAEEIHQQDLEQLRKWLNRLGASQDGKSSGE